MPTNLAPPSAPASLVPLALLLLIFHGLLGADYVIERFALGGESWPGLMRLLPLGALWLQVVWALGVWLGVAAAFFLTIRDNASVLLFFAATLAQGALSATLLAGHLLDKDVRLAAAAAAAALKHSSRFEHAAVYA